MPNQAVPSLAEALKTKAICESGSQAAAASALIGAAAAVLSIRFPPHEVASIIVEVAVESLAEQVRRTPLLALDPAGRA